MLDPKFLRNEIEETAKKLATRGFELDIDLIKQLEEQRKVLQVKTETLQSQRNSRSKEIGMAAKRGEDIAPLRAEMGKLGEELDAAKEEFSVLSEQIQQIAYTIPNIPHDTVPVGKDENENVEISTWGHQNNLILK